MKKDYNKNSHCDYSNPKVINTGKDYPVTLSITRNVPILPTYKNPILHIDYSDPDVIRVGENYYMTASTFNNIPGLPILHSKDLVNWELINYAIKYRLPFDTYNKPQYGKGVWAPAIRYYNEYFYIYFGMPDEGIFMTKTKDIYGDWEELVCLKSCQGYIDTCPFWDDDGSAYLINAFAKSRIGFKSVLAIHKMSEDGTTLLDDFKIVYDGNGTNPTIEGPKLYKRNGYYYISAPAGGVTNGWQLILRSKNLYGPYEEKVVLHQGNSSINGPHQGGIVEGNHNETWFIHFQDKGCYGRVCHLQPVKWIDNWPIIGIDTNNDGIGEPVMEHCIPIPFGTNIISSHLHLSFDFINGEIGCHWQWNANINKKWWSKQENKLRLIAVNDFQGELPYLRNAPNLLMQKFPALSFKVVTKFHLHLDNVGEKAGFGVMGDSYASMEIVKNINNSYTINLLKGIYTNNILNEYVASSQQLHSDTVYLKLNVVDSGICEFSYSIDSINYNIFSEKHVATTCTWVGSKFFLYALSNYNNNSSYVTVDFVEIEKQEN